MGDLLMTASKAHMEDVPTESAKAVYARPAYMADRGFATYEAIKGMKCAISAFKSFISTMPAAYDVDKATEKIKEVNENGQNKD